MASWIAGRMICVWRASGLGSGVGEVEMRVDRAWESVRDACLAWQVCSSRKLSIFSRPRRVSDLQLRVVFSSALSYISGFARVE